MINRYNLATLVVILVNSMACTGHHQSGTDTTSNAHGHVNTPQHNIPEEQRRMTGFGYNPATYNNEHMEPNYQAAYQPTNQEYYMQGNSEATRPGIPHPPPMNTNPAPAPGTAHQSTNEVAHDPFTSPNSQFLKDFLSMRNRSSITLESLVIRFGTGLVNHLSSGKIARVLIASTDRRLNLTGAERSVWIEMLFGQIDFAIDKKYTNKQVVNIVEAILRSDVPECFEQVYLTCKMWKRFTVAEQRRMFECVGFGACSVDVIRRRYTPKTLVMLYLFVVNADDDYNSKLFSDFKMNIRYTFGIDNSNGRITNALMETMRYPTKNGPSLFLAFDRFDNCLLDLPEVLAAMSGNIIELRNVIRLVFHSEGAFSVVQNHSVAFNFSYRGARYKIHVCYALTKFTENILMKQEGGLWSRFYFDPEDLLTEFKAWQCNAKDESPGQSTTKEASENEFRNYFGALRQVTQCKEYDENMFLGLYTKPAKFRCVSHMYKLYLYLFTSVNIVRKARMIEKIAEADRNNGDFLYTMDYFEKGFIATAFPEYPDGDTPDYLAFKVLNSVESIVAMESTLRKPGCTLLRERCFSQHALFHPEYKYFKEGMAPHYLKAMKNAGYLQSDAENKQLLRGWVISDFYYEKLLENFDALGGLEPLKGDLNTVVVTGNERVRDVVNMYRRRERRELGIDNPNDNR